MPHLNVLLIEDDDEYRARLSSALAQRGYKVAEVQRAQDGLAALRHGGFDAAVMDRMLPDGDAIVHLAQWRDKGITLPVILLTGLAEVSDRVGGLDAGADDYVLKPATVDEIDARLRALVRRSIGRPPVATDLIFGTLRLDRLKREVWRGSRRVHLQPRELRILEELALAEGDIVPRSVLLKAVWNLNFDPKTKLIETHISRLREKLSDGDDFNPIETVRGSGYRLRAS